MDLSGLRRLAVELPNDAHGVDITVTIPGESPVNVKGIWIRPQFDDQPYGTDLEAREPRRVMALRRDQFPKIPRNADVQAPYEMGGTPVAWKVDGFLPAETSYFRVKMTRVL